jgi:hypothetical protein
MRFCPENCGDAAQAMLDSTHRMSASLDEAERM